MPFNNQERLREARITVLGRPLVLGFRNSSIVISMPGIMNGHFTLMKYVDPNHPYYNKWDVHITNINKEHRTLLNPISEEDLGIRIGYLQDYIKDSEINPEDSEFARENFFDLNNIGNFISMRKSKRRIDMSLDRDSILDALMSVKTVKGRDIFGSGANNTDSRRVFIQESDPSNMLVSARGRNIMVNQKVLTRKTSEALDFDLNKDAFDILR